MTPTERRTSALICFMWLWRGWILASVTTKDVEIEESNVSTGSDDEIKASGLPFTARGKMTSILVFCGRANFLIKVHDSAADSPCYLWRRRGPSLLPVKGKTPLERKHWSLWRHALCFRGWKGQWSTSRWLLWLQPHRVHWCTVKYVLLSFDNAESKRDLWGCWCFAAVKAAPLFGVCCGSWVDTHCCHRKELISNPVVGETRQLHLLAYRHTRSFAIATFEREKMPKQKVTVWPQRSHVLLSMLITGQLSAAWSTRGMLVLFGLPAMTWWDWTPGGAGAVIAYIPAADLLKSPPIIHRRFPFHS